jgi:DNA-binding CsgD family transcriptional regulator
MADNRNRLLLIMDAPLDQETTRVIHHMLQHGRARVVGPLTQQHAPAWETAHCPALTPRQLEIARLASTGLTNREIAAILTISHRTVANHLQAIYDRTGASNRHHLTRFGTNHLPADILPYS